MLGRELVKPAGPISLDDRQKLNIQILSYHQAIKGEVYNAEIIYNLWPTTGGEELLRRAGARPSITAIQQYQQTAQFREGMAERGIEVDDSIHELTPEQTACIALLCNYTDRRTPRGKLQALGIPFSKYVGWMKQKAFNDAIKAVAGKGLEEAIPLAEVALSQKAAEGDLNAIKFFMEVTGRHNPAQQQAVDAQQLVSIMVDAAQEVLGSDPEMLRRYIDTVKLRAQAVKGVIL
jgi:hypothetical protein